MIKQTELREPPVETVQAKTNRREYATSLIIASLALVIMITASAAYLNSRFTLEKALAIAQVLLNEAITLDEVRLVQTAPVGPGDNGTSWGVFVNHEDNTDQIICFQPLFHSVKTENCAVKP